MKLGIMQPYFFPYLGYWQLLNAVDQYVIYDDVNFIKGGWINRNRILVNGVPQYINVPMLGASPNKRINEVGVNSDMNLINKNLRIINTSYKKAPYFDTVYPMIESILKCSKTNLATYLEYSIFEIAKYLNINTKLLISSELEKDTKLRGEDKVLAICELLDAKEYYNAIGGKELYDFEHFKKRGMALKFIKTNEVHYSQFDLDFQPNLSIIDVMMFNSRESVIDMLKEYTLVTE